MARVLQTLLQHNGLRAMAVIALTNPEKPSLLPRASQSLKRPYVLSLYLTVLATTCSYYIQKSKGCGSCTVQRNEATKQLCNRQAHTAEIGYIQLGFLVSQGMYANTKEHVD